jgi:hypothetical protein
MMTKYTLLTFFLSTCSLFLVFPVFITGDHKKMVSICWKYTHVMAARNSVTISPTIDVIFVRMSCWHKLYSISLHLWSIYNYGPLCRETSRFVNLRGSCFPKGLPEGKQPPEGWQIWMFPYTEGRNCFIIFLPMFYRLSPLWGKIGLFGGEQ